MTNIRQLTAESVRELTFDALEEAIDEVRENIERIEQDGQNPAMKTGDPARKEARQEMVRIMTILGRESHKREENRWRRDDEDGGVETVRIDGVPR